VTSARVGVVATARVVAGAKGCPRNCSSAPAVATSIAQAISGPVTGPTAIPDSDTTNADATNADAASSAHRDFRDQRGVFSGRGRGDCEGSEAKRSGRYRLAGH